MEKALQDKLRRVRGIIASCPAALVSYSGGVDSTLLARLAHEVLGDRMLAVTFSSPLMPPRELARARALAEELGFPHLVVEADELALPGFELNPRDRCYLCKRHRLQLLRGLAEERGCEAVLEGSNRDDASLHRPGRRACEELGAASPLEEAGMNKEDVRAAARALGLPNWDAPSRPCLATRFPYGTRLEPGLIARVDAAEEFLEGQGLRQLRVRLEGPDAARIEAGEEEMVLLRGEEVRERLVKKFLGLGFRRVALDLEGLRSGSMDEKKGDRRCVELYIEDTPGGRGR